MLIVYALVMAAMFVLLFGLLYGDWFGLARQRYGQPPEDADAPPPEKPDDSTPL